MGFTPEKPPQESQEETPAQREIKREHQEALERARLAQKRAAEKRLNAKKVKTEEKPKEEQLADLTEELDAKFRAAEQHNEGAGEGTEEKRE